MACEIHEGDIGTAFRLTITDCAGAVVDLSSATIKQIIFRKPDQTSVTQTATFFTDGTDGIVEYITVADDLDQVGQAWCIQFIVTLATGAWKSNIKTFAVYSNL